MHYISFFIYYLSFFGHMDNMPFFISSPILQYFIFKYKSFKKLHFYSVFLYKDFFSVLRFKGFQRVSSKIQRPFNPLKVKYYAYLAGNLKKYSKLYKVNRFSIFSASFYNNILSKFRITYFFNVSKSLQTKTSKLYKIKFSDSSVTKHINLNDLNNYVILYIRKNKIFNKGRYSRNRQLYKTGVY